MIGRNIHNYKIEELIGEGGMGTVYRAVDTMLGREVALKMLHPKLLQQATFFERFKNEAQVLAKLNHPNIAILHNFVKDGDDYFMVMEYVEGDNLETILRKHGNLPLETAIPIIRQALDGLAHAHKKGILHRDIKPANLILTPEGTVKLMDFGIAKVMGGQKLTQVNRLVGTLEYLSPEQIQGQEPSPQSDIYAVGVLLFELLSGKLPYEATTDYDLMQKIISHKPLTISQLNKETPKAVEQIISKCLQKKPEQRFTDSIKLNEELSKITNIQQITLPHKKAVVQSIKATSEISVSDKATTFIKTSKITDSTKEILTKLPARKEFWILAASVFVALGILSWAIFGKTDEVVLDDDTKDSVKVIKPIPQNPDNQVVEQQKTDSPNPEPVSTKEKNEDENKKEKEKNKEKTKEKEKKTTETKPIETKPIETKPIETYKPPIAEPPPVVIQNKPTEEKKEVKNEKKSVYFTNNRLTLELVESVKSKQAAEGQSVRFRVVNPIVIDGKTVIQAGATARGTITELKAATFLRKESLEIRIKEVEAVNGQWVSLRASTFKEVAKSSNEGVSFNSGQTFVVETSSTKLNF